MKINKIYTIGLFLIAMTFNSCEEALQEEVFSFIAPENFYNSATDAEAALVGVYAGFRLIHMYDRHYMIGDMGSDDTFTGEFRGNQDRIQIDEFTVDPNNGIIRERYENAYITINRANAVISRVPGIEMNSQQRENIVNQARFLRALLYFDLVQLFGNVPLKIEETLNVNDVASPRVDFNRIYDEVIIPDLQAAESLPESPRLEGQATNTSAKALLARVYLARAGNDPNSPYWALARNKANEVIESGQHRLLNDFRDVFQVENQNSQEHVFSIQFSSLQGVGSSFQEFFMPRGINSTTGNGNGVNEPTPDIVQAYEEGDLRYNTTFLLELPLANGTSNFYDPKGSCQGFPTPCIPQPYIGKYLEIAPPRGNLNYPILRYSDVLLMYAEAANEANGGPTGEAYSAINQVRNRAGLPDLAQGLSRDQFRQAVRHERRVELAFEGIRRYDLVRWGTLLEVTREHFQRFYPNLSGNVRDHHLLFPIPQREIDLNPGISLADQNPGY
ncbi:RagB/SusD family nutrient uptake outer membrane protein [Arthrospiribacter ruber]|uniref:RagB/SusD family nutrient uptake outer membrane protein n=1 Tax=Arthrospiribacter ruber TaxID=2487934 RepID=A0A951MCS6_9BACT|nr:RagB/SusD family nutrient uptake outer membrane protein [Arthrospiribacter ruber]MBW3467832.1 RagB/SusD family nutrient uptake outer membrane protein [Arthrospiribacter ruber]